MISAVGSSLTLVSVRRSVFDRADSIDRSERIPASRDSASGKIVPPPTVGAIPAPGATKEVREVWEFGIAPNLRERSKVDFQPHDLRRTAASHMASFGVPRLVVSKLLNHVESGVTSVYDRHSYDAEKRHALDTWGARLEEIVTGHATPVDDGKVVALR